MHFPAWNVRWLKKSGIYPVLLIADTLRLLGQGTNVAVEVVVMAISDHQQS